MVFQKIARKLNDWENHRTNSEHQNNLINKVFWFKLVNLYSPMIYISFLKSTDHGVGYCKGSWLQASFFKKYATAVEADVCLPFFNQEKGMLDPGNATEVKNWPSANDFLRFCCNITSTIYSKL